MSRCAGAPTRRVGVKDDVGCSVVLASPRPVDRGGGHLSTGECGMAQDPQINDREFAVRARQLEQQHHKGDLAVARRANRIATVALLVAIIAFFRPEIVQFFLGLSEQLKQ